MRRHRLTKLSALLDKLDLLLGRAPESVRELYDRAAPDYDAFRALWVRLIGGPAEEAMLDDLRATLRPGHRVLDAGCGTGAISRQILDIEPRAELTLLDLSVGMLDRARDIAGRHILGDVQRLPFLDDYFDVVVSAWAIETVPDPIRAAREYVRVINESGHVFYTFSSLPEGWLSRAGLGLLREVVEEWFAGEFLPPEKTPWHDCERSHRYRFAGGATTEIALRKCCQVGPAITPPAGDERTAVPTPRL